MPTYPNGAPNSTSPLSGALAAAEQAAELAHDHQQPGWQQAAELLNTELVPALARALLGHLERCRVDVGPFPSGETNSVVSWSAIQRVFAGYGVTEQLERAAEDTSG